MHIKMKLVAVVVKLHLLKVKALKVLIIRTKVKMYCFKHYQLSIMFFTLIFVLYKLLHCAVLDIIY